MVYRKKILLALLEQFDGELAATEFQKLLFLLSDQIVERAYHFVPYKYGCFSFQACADKQPLVNEGYLKDSKSWILAFDSKLQFYNSLSESDRLSLDQIKRKYLNIPVNQLVRHVYLNYPFFAINSEIASKVLTDNELKVIDRFRPQPPMEEHLYTIGYEGRSLEQYLSTLIQKNVKVLVDVRKNPISRKYGFSKKVLGSACEKLDIKYVHLPELGIPGELRRHLTTQADYDKLFTEYKSEILPGQESSLEKIITLLIVYKSIALTCYELSPAQCHRSAVSNAVGVRHSSVTISHI